MRCPCERVSVKRGDNRPRSGQAAHLRSSLPRAGASGLQTATLPLIRHGSPFPRLVSNQKQPLLFISLLWTIVAVAVVLPPSCYHGVRSTIRKPTASPSPASGQAAASSGVWGRFWAHRRCAYLPRCTGQNDVLSNHLCHRIGRPAASGLRYGGATPNGGVGLPSVIGDPEGRGVALP